MKNLIKITAALTILLTAAFASGRQASASEFNLESLSAADLRGTEFKAARVAKPRPPKAEEDDMIGLDLSIRVPFKALKKVMVMVAASNKSLSIVDPSKPVIERSGELLKVVNIRVNVNGIVAEPVVTLKPYFEGRDKLAIRVQRVQMHAAMAPTPGLTGTPVAIPAIGDSEAVFNKEDMVADIIGIITGGITDALNESLKENQSPLKAGDIVTFKYDKAAWTLHTVISAAALKRYMPEGLVGDVHMTGFSLADNALAIKFN